MYYTSELASLSLIFFVSYSLNYFFLCCKWSFNTVCRTTGLDDTYQTLNKSYKAISFKLEANNFSKIFTFVSIREEICQVSVSVYPLGQVTFTFTQFRIYSCTCIWKQLLHSIAIEYVYWKCILFNRWSLDGVVILL